MWLWRTAHAISYHVCTPPCGSYLLSKEELINGLANFKALLHGVAPPGYLKYFFQTIQTIIVRCTQKFV